MAELFLAQDTTNDALVVLKRILPYLAHEDEFVQMFLDEARIASLLSHPNVVRVFELGNLEGSIYIAMEYVEGIDLRTLLQEEGKRGGQVPYGIASFIVAQLCRGLHYAHTARDLSGNPLHIVHRDISPQNVMVGFDAQVKLVDFGIAKAGLFIERSKPGVIKGKFLYLAPEQLSQEETDHRADLFALGTLLYELTTGKSPFSKSTTEAVIYAIRSEEPAPPYAHRPGFPKELARIISRCLVKDRARRYQSAAEIQADLERFLRMTERTTQEEVVRYIHGMFGDEEERTLIHIPVSELLNEPHRALPPKRPALGASRPLASPPLPTPPLAEQRPDTTLPAPMNVSELGAEAEGPTILGGSLEELLADRLEELTPVARASSDVRSRAVPSRMNQPPVSRHSRALPPVRTPPPDAGAGAGHRRSQMGAPPVLARPTSNNRGGVGNRITAPPAPSRESRQLVPVSNPRVQAHSSRAEAFEPIAQPTAFDEPDMPTAIHAIPTDFREHLLAVSGTTRRTKWYEAPDVRMWLGLAAAFVLLVSGFLLWALRAGTPETTTLAEESPLSSPSPVASAPSSAPSSAPAPTPGAADPRPAPAPAGRRVVDVQFAAPAGTLIAADETTYEPGKTYALAPGTLRYRFVCPGKKVQIHTQSEIPPSTPGQTLSVDCANP